MKLTFTSPALADLDEILAYTRKHHPTSLARLRKRIDAVSNQLQAFPQSGRALDNAQGVRVAPLIRFPFRIFYRIADGRIEVLHVWHASRKAPFAD